MEKTEREFEEYVIKQVKKLHFNVDYLSSKKAVRVDFKKFKEQFDLNAKNSRVFRYSFADVAEYLTYCDNFLTYYKNLLSASDYNYHLAEIVCTKILTNKISQAHDELVDGIRFTESNAKYYKRLMKIYAESVTYETFKDVKAIRENAKQL